VGHLKSNFPGWQEEATSSEDMADAYSDSDEHAIAGVYYGNP
jgi:hypothetical protein